jgi:hypothetical protein
MCALWIELHSQVRHHPKLFKLAERLGRPANEALGILVFLWLWAAQYAEDGNLSGFSDADLGRAVFLPAEQMHDIVEACVETRWLDRDLEKNTLLIHDWKDWGASFLIDARKRARKSRQRKRKQLMHGR